ncbi:MAG: methylmalonyl-CoA carboxyltransferase, partial [Proteobacteria bacterium]|nr:methylmalonyl-CoA carboxyltransferase [Pseudomonadota bacterium]
MENEQKGSTEEKLRLFEAKKADLMTMGGEKMVLKQHEQAKLTARERVALLFDAGTFQEIQLFVKHRSTLFGLGEKEIPADGVVTGYGNIDGRRVYVFSQDFTCIGGTLSEIQAKKIRRLMDQSQKSGCPFICINDSG